MQQFALQIITALLHLCECFNRKASVIFFYSVQTGIQAFLGDNGCVTVTTIVPPIPACKRIFKGAQLGGNSLIVF